MLKEYIYVQVKYAIANPCDIKLKINSNIKLQGASNFANTYLDRIAFFILVKRAHILKTRGQRILHEAKPKLNNTWIGYSKYKKE